MLPATIAVFVGMIIIELSNTFINPKLITRLERFSRDKKEESHLKAILRQKQPDTVEEEYIKGINY
jgi:hypothetical protein